MPEVLKVLESEHRMEHIPVTYTDLYPNTAFAKTVNEKGNPDLKYLTESVDATQVPEGMKGVRTMVCSMHHMRPETAKAILKDAMEDKQPICVFEISDNSFPKWVWWTAIPINFLMVFFITPMVRPFSWQQFVFTYLIPILPLFIAWDGAVSNARTYTQEDWKLILADLQSDDYVWETGIIKNKAKKSYLLGLPQG